MQKLFLRNAQRISPKIVFVQGDKLCNYFDKYFRNHCYFDRTTLWRRMQVFHFKTVVGVHNVMANHLWIVRICFLWIKSSLWKQQRNLVRKLEIIILGVTNCSRYVMTFAYFLGDVESLFTIAYGSLQSKKVCRILQKLAASINSNDNKKLQKYLLKMAPFVLLNYLLTVVSHTYVYFIKNTFTSGASMLSCTSVGKIDVSTVTAIEFISVDFRQNASYFYKRGLNNFSSLPNHTNVCCWICNWVEIDSFGSLNKDNFKHNDFDQESCLWFYNHNWKGTNICK